MFASVGYIIITPSKGLQTFTFLSSLSRKTTNNVLSYEEKLFKLNSVFIPVAFFLISMCVRIML